MRNTFVYSMNWTGFCVTSTENRHVGQLTFFFPRLQSSWNVDFGVTDTFLSVGKSANSESANKNHPLNI